MRSSLLSVGLAAGLLIALLGSVTPAGGADSAFRVEVLVLTTVDGEQEPFLRRQQWESTMALLRDPRLQLDRQSLFIVAGIAGIRDGSDTACRGRVMSRPVGLAGPW